MDSKIKDINRYIKANYKNLQDKWHDNYANRFIKLIKKNSKITFSRNSKEVY